MACITFRCQRVWKQMTSETSKTVWLNKNDSFFLFRNRKNRWFEINDSEKFIGEFFVGNFLSYFIEFFYWNKFYFEKKRFIEINGLSWSNTCRWVKKRLEDFIWLISFRIGRIWISMGIAMVGGFDSDGIGRIVQFCSVWICTGICRHTTRCTFSISQVIRQLFSWIITVLGYWLVLY